MHSRHDKVVCVCVPPLGTETREKEKSCRAEDPWEKIQSKQIPKKKKKKGEEEGALKECLLVVSADTSE